jgi:hypothetical protein
MAEEGGVPTLSSAGLDSGLLHAKMAKCARDGGSKEGPPFDAGCSDHASPAAAAASLRYAWASGPAAVSPGRATTSDTSEELAGRASALDASPSLVASDVSSPEAML